MKKFILLLFLFIVTGCNKENILKCELNNKIDYGSSKQIIEIVDNDDKISKITIKNSFDINDEFNEFYSTIFDSVYNTYSNSLNDKNGIKITADKNKSNFEIKIIIDINEVDEDIKKEMFDDNIKTVAELKTSLIKDGYICN